MKKAGWFSLAFAALLFGVACIHFYSNATCSYCDHSAVGDAIAVIAGMAFFVAGLALVSYKPATPGT
jgi:hypothetical protein